LEGQKAGVKNIAVTWGVHGEEIFNRNKPFKIINNWDELWHTKD
jgi:hypothetical protein